MVRFEVTRLAPGPYLFALLFFRLSLAHLFFDPFKRLCTTDTHFVFVLLQTSDQFTATRSDAGTYSFGVGLAGIKSSGVDGVNWLRKCESRRAQVKLLSIDVALSRPRFCAGAAD